MMQVDNLEKFLAWVKSSPCQFTVSSMSNECVHVKFNDPCDEKITRTRCYNTLELKPKVPQRTVEQIMYNSIDELMNKCYEDGFQDGRLAEYDSKENGK